MATFALAVVLFLAMMNQETEGVIYTRWGRNTCNSPSQLLYTGFVASGAHNHPGSGANYLCAHKNPQYGSGNVAGTQPYSGLLYGVEFELHSGYTNNLPFSYAKSGVTDLHNNDAVCAVCYNAKARDEHMVVGRQDCPSSDMRLEYSGYLVSEHYGFNRGEFVCMDSSPEVRTGGEANQDGGLFYPVQGVCGSLPCPPYINYNEITCAVCTI